MVNARAVAARPAAAAAAAATWLRRDWRGFVERVLPGRSAPAGLYPYRLALPGGRRWVHLRLEADGRGLLFVDVQHVLHLHPIAAALAKRALDGEAEDRAVAALRSMVPDLSLERLRAEAGAVYALLAALQTSPEACPAALAAVRSAAPSHTPLSAPYKADLALGYGCNNACAHCYNEPQRKALRRLSTREWRRVLDRLARLGIPHAIFTGGEPTLHEDLPALVRHAAGLGLVTGANTNGRRLADETFTGRLAAAGLDHVQITLGSPRAAVHNAMTGAASFDETVRGIRAAVDAGLHTITNTTLTARNRDHAEAVVDFVAQLGVKTFAMNGMIHAGRGRCSADALAEEELAPILAAVRERAAARGLRFLWYTPTEYCRLSPLELELGARCCNAAQYSLCIEPNGDVLPCQSYYEPAGNLLRDPWERIWHGALFRRFRDRFAFPQRAGLPERCWDCPDLEVCGGGCPLACEAAQTCRAAG